jgi:hypothetical protein
MANMSESQRAQTERSELGYSKGDRMLSAQSKRWPLIYLAIMIPLLVVGIALVIMGIDEWWQGLVLGVIILTVIGMMIAISPNRRG